MNQWNPYGDIEQQAKQVSDEQLLEDMKLNKDFFHTFNTDAGKRVLDYFQKHTIDYPCFIPGAPKGYGEWRDGQNNIIREIKVRMEKATKENK